MCRMPSAQFVLLILAISSGLCSSTAGDQIDDSISSSNPLGIFGNADMNDRIDEADAAYVRRIIEGKSETTKLSDANYDGKVDSQDIDQIEKIINGENSELTLIDDTITDEFPEGIPVTIHLPVSRIVALNQDAAEVLLILQSTDKIIGIADSIAEDIKFPPEISKLPLVGSSSDADVEKILKLKPDMVLTYGSDLTRWTIGLEKDLKAADITLLRLNCYKPATMSSDIIKLGYIFDNRAIAEEFVDWYENYTSVINERVGALKEDGKPRVYVERSLYKAYSNGSAAHEIVVMAGGENIAADLNSIYPEVDPEWVIDQNPEIILKTATSGVIGGYVDDTSQMKGAWDEIMNRSELANVKAVKENKVYVIHTQGVWNNPEYFIGLIYLGKWFHPDLFEDLDPQAIHQEFLDRFLGLDYDLNEHGTFVYPPLEMN